MLGNSENVFLGGFSQRHRQDNFQSTESAFTTRTCRGKLAPFRKSVSYFIIFYIFCTNASESRLGVGFPRDFQRIRNIQDFQWITWILRLFQGIVLCCVWKWVARLDGVSCRVVAAGQSETSSSSGQLICTFVGCIQGFLVRIIVWARQWSVERVKMAMDITDGFPLFAQI